MDNKKIKALPPFLLRLIYIRKSNCSLDASFDPLLPNQQLIGFNKVDEGHIKSQEIIDEKLSGGGGKIKSCVFSTKFHFGYKLNTGEVLEEADFVAQISAEIAVDYQITTENFPDQDQLNQWATSNCLFHVWPYWREFCQSSQQRMNLPITMIPMLDIDRP